MKFMSLKCEKCGGSINLSREEILGLALRDRNFFRFMYYIVLARHLICPSCKDVGTCERPCERIGEFIHERAPYLMEG